MRTHLLRPLVGLALLLGALAAPRTAAAQKALVYCPPSDPSGCDAIAASLAGAPAFQGGVDKAYDGTLGSVDLKTADLNAYAAFVVPSLSDDASPSPYALLRDSTVAARLRNALLGRRALWSGSPDQGSTNHDMKEALVRNLASWAAGNFAAANGPGLVVLRDATADDARRYGWLRTLLGVNVTADPKVVSYSSVRGLTAAATEILTYNGSPIAYTNMAAYGFQLPTGAANVSLDAVGQTGTTDGGQVVLVTMQNGNTGGAAVMTDRDDYAPGEPVTITGSGFDAGESIAITLHEDPLVHQDRTLTATADGSGKFVNANFTPELHDIGVRFVVTAVGASSGKRAQATFTDGNSTVTGVVKSSSGAALAGVIVQCTAGCNSAASTTTDANGAYSLAVNFAGGNDGSFKLTASLAGYASVDATVSVVNNGPRTQNFTLTASISATTLSVAPSSGTYGGSVALSATLTAGSPAAGVSGKTISFTLNGTPAGSATTNAQGVATIAAASLAGISGGTYATGVGASFAGDASYASASGTASLTVGPASQTIAFLPLPDKQTTDVPFAVSATASSGLPVSFTASGKCTISGTTVTLGQGAGTCTITASQAGNASYGPAADVPQTFNVVAVTPTITWANPAPITYGTALSATQLNATASVAGSFAYTPAAGTVLNAGAGQTLSVTFTPTDGTSYTTATKSVTIDVTQGTQSITFAGLPNRTYGDAPFTVSATASSGLPVSFAVGGTDACTISGATITLTKAGSCTVTATQGGDANFVAAAPVAQAFQILTATPLFSALSAPEITYGDASATISGKLLAGSLAPQDAPVTITIATGGAAMSTTSNVAADGSFSASFSTATLAANASGYPVALSYSSATGNFAGATDNSLKLVVKPRAATLTLGDLEQTYDGSPKAVSVTSNPAGVTYAVTYGGAPTAPTAAGSYAVVATVTDGNYTGSASGTLVIKKAKATLSLSGLTHTYDGTAKTATVTVDPVAATGLTVTYDGGPTAPVNAGSYAVAASLTNANYEADPVTGTLEIAKAAQTIAWATPASIVYGTALSGSQLNATATGAAAGSAPGALSYSPAAGAVLGAGTHTLSVTAAETQNYLPASKTVQLVVEKATPVVTWATPAEIVYGTPLSATQLNATANVPGTFAYSPAPGTVLNAGVGQTLSVGFVPNDQGNYNDVPSTTVQITVAKAAQVITWADPTAITYGTSLGATQLNATVVGVAGGSEPGTLSYTPAAGTLLGAGSQTLMVVAAETPNYNQATKSVSLVVNKAAPTITWATPAPITYGTPLSSTQLNASVTGVTGGTQPGAVTYDPAAGTVLGAGTRTLKLDVAESENYLAGSASVQLTVEKFTPTAIVTWAGKTYDAAPQPATAKVTGIGSPAVELTTPATTLTYHVGSTASGTTLVGPPVNAGTYTVRASYAGDDNYNPTSATQTITIARADQVITWATPAAITYGTALSSAQLNAAVAGVTGGTLPGALTYSPLAGTILNAGAQTLRVDAAATDNYNAAFATVQLTVDRAPVGDITFTELVKAYNASLQGPRVASTPTNVKLKLEFWQDVTVRNTVSGVTTSVMPGVAPVGVYRVKAIVDDPNYLPKDAEALFVIYDPSGGFVTGGGWITSPTGACSLNATCSATATGKANFGFVSKYQKGATVPTGNTEFQFHAGGLNFKSISYEWLTVAGARAQYKGIGTINGSGNYGFMLTAIDGEVNGGGGSDRFRIKIWDRSDGDRVVYDNQVGTGDDAALSTDGTALAGGSISIKK